MGELAVSSTAALTPMGASPNAARRQKDDPSKIHDAAQQFEALLIGQMLRSERESGGGWLGSSDGDPTGDSATEYAEQQFATLLARQGGLGLADLIAKGIKSAQSAIDSHSAQGTALPAPPGPAETKGPQR